MYPTDNCGITYFTINFVGENEKGFSEYADGFSPEDISQAEEDISLPGCWVADDFEHTFGDSQEALLSTALFYRQNERCPEPSELPLAVLKGVTDPNTHGEGYMYVPLPLQNAIVK
jgi:hypothetical protein